MTEEYDYTYRIDLNSVLLTAEFILSTEDVTYLCETGRQTKYWIKDAYYVLGENKIEIDPTKKEHRLKLNFERINHA